MKHSKLLAFTFVFTIVCFSVSYVSLAMNKGENSEWSFPPGLLQKYIKINQDKNSHTRLTKEFQLKQISQFEIQTTSADIEFYPSTSDTIRVELEGKISDKANESDLFEISEEENKISLKSLDEKGSAFTIQDKNDFSLNFNLGDDSRTFRIYLPAQVQMIDVKTISGDTSFSELKLDLLKLRSISGDLHMNDVTVTQLAIKSISGDCELNGVVDQVEMQSTSGDLHVLTQNKSPNIRVKTTSGDTSIQFSEKPNVQVQLKTLSGNLEIDENLLKNNKTKMMATLGDGAGSVVVQSTSGNLSIQ